MSRAEEQRSQTKARTLSSEARPLCANLVPRWSLRTLGAGLRWVAMSGERNFTTETKTVFPHRNADARPKGILSQSAVLEVNRGYKLDRGLCTDKGSCFNPGSQAL